MIPSYQLDPLSGITRASNVTYYPVIIMAAIKVHVSQKNNKNTKKYGYNEEHLAIFSFPGSSTF